MCKSRSSGIPTRQQGTPVLPELILTILIYNWPNGIQTQQARETGTPGNDTSVYDR